jgi:S1-C subfamily serine protease
MLKSILLFLVLFTPPANGHIDLAREYDDSYTSEVDPYAPRGLKNSYLSSVIIHSINEENFTGIGSGNYFKLGSHRFVITAAHVVSENTETRIVERGFESTTAIVAHIDHINDIAILIPETRLKYTKPIRFRRDINNQLGEKVYHCGHPASEGWHISEGILTGTHPEVLMINTFAWPGSSGSVVFDDTGSVVGVISSIRVDGPYGLPDMVEHIVLAGNIKTINQDTLRVILENDTR